MESTSTPSRTPRHLRLGPGLSRLNNDSIPNLAFQSDFFQAVKPKWWTFEGYLDHGYLDKDFLHDLNLGDCTARGPNLTLMKKHCRKYSCFFQSDDGKLLLRLMKAGHTVKQETQVAVMYATITGFRGQQEGPEGM